MKLEVCSDGGGRIKVRGSQIKILGQVKDRGVAQRGNL